MAGPNSRSARGTDSSRGTQLRRGYTLREAFFAVQMAGAVVVSQGAGDTSESKSPDSPHAEQAEQK